MATRVGLAGFLGMVEGSLVVIHRSILVSREWASTSSISGRCRGWFAKGFLYGPRRKAERYGGTGVIGSAASRESAASGTTRAD